MASFDPDIFQDRYQEALIELIRSKQAGKKPVANAHLPRTGNVINLMDALRRSLGSEKSNSSGSGRDHDGPTRPLMKSATSKSGTRTKRSKAPAPRKRIKKAS